MRRAISVLTLSVLVVVCAPTLADTLTDKVVKVADGDSITVLDNASTASGFKASTPQNENKPLAMPQGNTWRVSSQAKKSP